MEDDVDEEDDEVSDDFAEPEDDVDAGELLDDEPRLSLR